MTETVKRRTYKTGAGAYVFRPSHRPILGVQRVWLTLVLGAWLCIWQSIAQASLPPEGPLRLAPLQGELTRAQVKHLASRAGFGATQAETDALIGARSAGIT